MEELPRGYIGFTSLSPNIYEVLKISVQNPRPLGTPRVWGVYKGPYKLSVV